MPSEPPSSMDIPLVNRGHAGCDDPSSQHHGSRTSRDSHARAPQRHRSNGGGGGGGGCGCFGGGECSPSIKASEEVYHGSPV